MSDKEFNERDAFSNCFPSAKLLICLYHTLRSLRREVTCEKMGITSAERSHCLEILQAIAYSNTEDEYNSNVNLLRNTKIKSVIHHCQENWLPVKEQWVKCFKSQAFNLGETTNNRLGSTFNKIKSVCSKYANLIQFFTEFFTVLKFLRSDRNHHYLMSLVRRSTNNSSKSPVEKSYSNILTPCAYR